MPGPPPKAPGARRRRNQASTATQLVPLDPLELELRKPELLTRPDGAPWHPAALSYWDEIWLSPMSGEYTASDVHLMLLLIDLIHMYWVIEIFEKGAIRTKQILAAEIRLQAQNFGLSPLDRRRLQWQIAETEQAQEKTRRRTPPSASDPRAQWGTTQRSVLPSATG